MNSRPAVQDATISLVLPLLNEEAVLPRLLGELKRVLTEIGCRWNIVLVNDGSTDGSVELIDAMAYADRRLKVVHLSRNFGQQAAVQAGLAHAHGDAVVFMDSDGQDDPAALREMVQRWLAGDDVIYAVRFGRKEGLIKRFLFKAFYGLLHRFASIAIPRDAGNYSLVDRRVADLLMTMDESDRYLPGLRSWVGFRQSAVPVERFARHDKRPRVTLAGLCGLAKNAMFGFSRVPLQAFYGIALLAGLVSIGCIGFAVFHRLVTGAAIPGWASITSITAFFGAINALGIAILGEYVSRIYDQVRRRPAYVVDRTCNVQGNDRDQDLQIGHDIQSILRELNQLSQEAEVVASETSPRQHVESLSTWQ
ncbi:MAG: glycosyltransferase family 2 protein [Pirellulaceae bacterium]|nr:glycosyltransferase family 2 protein [Pirellulaceae bacterium]